VLHQTLVQAANLRLATTHNRMDRSTRCLQSNRGLSTDVRAAPGWASVIANTLATGGTAAPRTMGAITIWTYTNSILYYFPMPSKALPKPPDVFGRDHEWDDLVEFAMCPGPGLRLAIVRGRRRQGKSFLLRRLANACNGFYHQALEEEPTQAREGLGAALGQHLGVAGGRLAFDSWAQAVDALADQKATRDNPALVVLDEFPYMLDHSPELQSILQRAVDSRRSSDASPVRLILCGSALAVMSKLLAGTRALRGRATLDLVIQSFGHRDAADFWGIARPQIAFHAYAVFGGTPGYRDLLTAPPPKTLSAFGGWLGRGPLNPASALFREDDYLLTGEPTLTDRGLYHSVITAIADGRTT